MKVLHINCNYLNSKLHQTMLDHFDDSIENTVYCPVKSLDSICDSSDSNIIIDKCFTKYDRLIYFYKQNKIKKSIWSKIDIGCYDIIHAYTLFTDGNVAMNISKKTGIPYVVAVRGTDINEFFTYRPYLLGRAMNIMENAAQVFFLSDKHKEKMLSKYVPKRIKEKIKNKSIVVPNGIDDYWLNNRYTDRNIIDTKKRLEKRKMNIICVSQIIKDKNIPFVQDIIKHLSSHGWDVSFSIIGKKVEKKEYKRIIQDKNTTYYEPMNKEKLIYKYRENDIFIMLSHYETFGLVYAEAMSQGLPVIYTKGQGFDGQFEDGKVGFSASDKNLKDGIEKINQIVLKYEELSRNCMNECVCFDWNIIAEKYRGIYTKIVK